MSSPRQTVYPDSNQVPNQTFKCPARISAVHVITKLTGETTLGSLTQVEPGTPLEICGEGYNQRTIKVRSGHNTLYVFRQDLVVAETEDSSVDCMHDLPTFSDSHGETQSERTEFLRADLALCFQLADLADTVHEMDDLNAALRVKSIAEGGHDTIARFLPNLDDGTVRDQLQQQLNALRLRLDALRPHHLQAPGETALVVQVAQPG